MSPIRARRKLVLGPHMSLLGVILLIRNEATWNCTPVIAHSEVIPEEQNGAGMCLLLLSRHMWDEALDMNFCISSGAIAEPPSIQPTVGLTLHEEEAGLCPCE